MLIFEEIHIRTPMILKIDTELSSTCDVSNQELPGKRTALVALLVPEVFETSRPRIHGLVPCHG